VTSIRITLPLALSLLLAACSDDTAIAVIADQSEDRSTESDVVEDDIVNELDGTPEVDSGTDIAPEDGPRVDADPDADPDAHLDLDSPGRDAEDAAADVGARVEISALSVVENTRNVLSFWVYWETNIPTETSLTVDCDSGHRASFSDANRRRSHSHLVIGLIASDRCDVSVTAYSGVGTQGIRGTSYTVGALPTFLPTLTVSERNDRPQQQVGWTLLNLNNSFDSLPVVAALVDELGRYRWYHQISEAFIGWDNALTAVDGGILFGGSAGMHTERLAWDGSTIWRAPRQSHHEAILLDDRRLLQLGLRADCPDGIPVGVPLVMFDVETEEQLWTWNLCEHYAPASNFQDWDHTNGIGVFPDGEHIVVSARKQSLLFRVDLVTNELEWTMGFGGRPYEGWNTDFEMAEADRFQEQHAPEVQTNGNILIFDNGDCSACPPDVRFEYARGYSRAVEIAYETDTWTAEVVWEFRPDPDIYAPIWGDADRLANGNTLVTFGRLSQRNTSHVVETTAGGTIVWELVLPPRWGVYRADRVAVPPLVQ